MTGSSHDPASPSGNDLRSARGTFRLASSKLDFAQNPVQQPGEGHGGHGHGAEDGHHPAPSRPERDDDGNSLIQFSKRESASTSELFYDLWFVANLTVFATVHPITEKETLVSFVGYFLLLWNTWFITTVHDARFIQDGILPRLARACHLAVMIGFAIVGSAFDKDNLIRPIIKAMSLFLTLSRLVLTAQYSLVLYHARHNKRGRKVLLVSVILHLLPAIAYLVAGVISNNKQDQHLIIIWYTVGLLELLSIIAHATLSKTLSFEGTHFNERLNLLTLIILGEGVILLTKNVSKIVKYTYLKGLADYWSPALIGTLFSVGALLFITFQLYFDWMHHHNHMAPWRHAIWTFLHLPFHAVLVLLAEGSSQWAVWWRAIEAYREAEYKLQKSVTNSLSNTTASSISSAVADSLKSTSYYLMKKYGTDMEDGSKNTNDLDAIFDEISKLPKTLWTQDIEDSTDADVQSWIDDYLGISRAVINSISEAFGLSVEASSKKSGASASWEDAELAAIEATNRRIGTIFTYLFISAGIVLMLLMVMNILSKTKGWTRFNMIRTGLVFAIGAGISLLSAIQTNAKLMSRFINSPWQLPTIAIAYFCVLILTHLPHPSQISLRPRQENEKDELSFAKDPSHSGGVEAGHPHGYAPQFSQEQAGDQSSSASGMPQHGQVDMSSYDGGHYQAASGVPQPQYHDPNQPYQTGYQQPETRAGWPTRGMTIRQGIASMQQAARNIHIERTPNDPTWRGHNAYPADQSGPYGLYRAG
ncbi:unnamed protein product [Clonostachys solani]|uniref:Uncharacterized protein n=1 Tax=Clonostachys solani TaxID=160281 RepID=A0A9N9ZLQ2_9HYPO|nr:unnamed protein product [Clonostachys solani]